VEPPLAFRYARPTDTFIALGDPAMTPDPPHAGEIVYADAEKCLCRRWNWYQDARSAIAPHTTRTVLTMQTLSADAPIVQKAAGHLADLIAGSAGGRAAWAVADSGMPRILVSPA